MQESFLDQPRSTYNNFQPIYLINKYLYKIIPWRPHRIAFVGSWLLI